MILEDVSKTMKLCVQHEIYFEQIFLLQVIADYQEEKDDIQSKHQVFLDYIKLLKTKTPSIEIRPLIEDLIEKRFLLDNRIDKKKLVINEFKIADKFYSIFKGNKTDEELFEGFKAIYPRMYASQSKAGDLPNFNMKASEERELLKVFQTKILSGDRKKKWYEFYYLTGEMFQDINNPSPLRIDRYVNTFWDNVELYRQQI